MNVRCVGLSGLLALTVAVCAAAEDPKADPKDRLVGVWEAVKSDLPGGTTLAFNPDGRLEVRIKTDKGTNRVEATYAVEGDRLTVQIGGSRNAEGREVVRIVKLTDKELTLKSDNGKVEEFKHVPSERK
jgi:uncharacterized protein (TIGR03066 family)